MQKITPCLWFDNQAEEAARFYTSIFKNSSVGTIAHYGDAGAAASGRPKGSVMTVSFHLDGQEFLALNGGPVFTFSPAISLIVHCDSQQELDEMWAKLSEGGSTQQCGWLQDKYGVSWQIVPAILPQLMNEANPAKSERVMAEIMKMNKLDIDTLKKA